MSRTYTVPVESRTYTIPEREGNILIVDEWERFITSDGKYFKTSDGKFFYVKVSKTEAMLLSAIYKVEGESRSYEVN